MPTADKKTMDLWHRLMAYAENTGAPSFIELVRQLAEAEDRKLNSDEIEKARR